jgi:hypothetical protein
MEIKAALRLLATDRRAVARKIFIEMDPYLKGSQFNNLDSSIRFTCELHPVLTVLQRIGFELLDDEQLRRDSTHVRVLTPHGSWNPVLHVI